jgi:alkanesulfonate monooxygenase SsuD/methylene tetrahydromethanopterin reductase-like flavin-dependent oxidoreductase (luciferase family)
MTDHDKAIHGPMRVGVVDGSELWMNSAGEYVRVRGADLRLIAHNAASAREEHPGMDVLVDIAVMIDASAAKARHWMDTKRFEPSTDTLTYVGTPAGLAGLVTDIHALGICDGAVLQPLHPRIVDVIRRRVIPELRSSASIRARPSQSWSA